MEYHKDIDVLIIDEFYAQEFNDNIGCFYEKIRELIKKVCKLLRRDI